ncbi:MAG TPA: hypothetical protein VLK32_06320 [Bacillota bacterium]|nr:hypothetical protein [Bacillota bacterium]
MSQRESRRVYIMERVVNGQLTVRQEAEFWSLSESQVKRLKRRVTAQGVAGLAGGLLKDATREHVAELLAERHRVRVSARSVRRIPARAGLTNRHARKSTRRRRSRDRMPQEGLLVHVVRRLSADWQLKCGRPICLLKTFVDRTRFRGTCYRAAGGRRAGETTGRSRNDRRRTFHLPTKDTCLYPLRRDFREVLRG